jgi:hypothetical protein
VTRDARLRLVLGRVGLGADVGGRERGDQSGKGKNGVIHDFGLTEN